MTQAELRESRRLREEQTKGAAKGLCVGSEGVNASDARLWHPWLRINRVLRVMLHTRWTQLGDVVAECGVPGREVVVRCPGLARWRRTPWIRGGPNRADTDGACYA